MLRHSLDEHPHVDVLEDGIAGTLATSAEEHGDDIRSFDAVWIERREDFCPRRIIREPRGSFALLLMTAAVIASMTS